MFRKLFSMTAIAMLGLVACTDSCKSDSKAEDTATSQAPELKLQDPVASVNGQSISEEKFLTLYKRAKGRFEKVGRTIPESLEGRIRQSILQQLVEEIVIDDAAKAQKLVISQEEKDAALAEYQDRMGGVEAFENFLKQLEVSKDELNQSLQANLMRKKLLDSMSGEYAPSTKDLQAYYDSNKDRFKQPLEVQASHILFKFEKDMTDEVKATKLESAKKALIDAKKKGANFAELAKKHSEGPTAPNGGDLGWFSKGRMIKEFEDAAFGAKVGDIVGPVETTFGYHVINVVGRKEEKQKTFAEVKTEIEENLKLTEMAKRSQEALAKLKEKAKIDVFEPSLKEEAAEEPVAKKAEEKVEAKG